MPENRGGHGGKLLIIEASEEGPSAVRLILDGELDLSNVGEMNEEIAKLEARDLDRLVIDLGAVTFIDSTGVACFVHLTERVRDRRTELRFVNGSRAIDRILRLTGLTELFPFEER